MQGSYLLRRADVICFKDIPSYIIFKIKTKTIKSQEDISKCYRNEDSVRKITVDSNCTRQEDLEICFCYALAMQTSSLFNDALIIKSNKLYLRRSLMPDTDIMQQDVLYKTALYTTDGCTV